MVHAATHRHHRQERLLNGVPTYRVSICIRFGPSLDLTSTSTLNNGELTFHHWLAPLARSVFQTYLLIGTYVQSQPLSLYILRYDDSLHVEWQLWSTWYSDTCVTRDELRLSWSIAHKSFLSRCLCSLLQ